MRCFITGITGFVGGYLASYLVSQGAEVGGIGLKNIHPETPTHTARCDILDFDKLVQHFDHFRPDFVYHLAALSNPSQSSRKPRNYYLVNAQGTVNVLEALRQNQINARILLVSSCRVYKSGSPGCLIGEDSPLAPNNPYAASKKLSEEIGLQYWKYFASRVLIVRPFNHTGPGQSEAFVVSDFCKQIALGEAEAARSSENNHTILVGNLKAKVDFLDVRDVVRAYAGVAQEGEEGEIYNVCSGVGTEISEVLDIALSLAEVEMEVVASSNRLRSDDNGWLVGNNEKLRTLLDWTPRHTLRQTIADILNAWRVSIDGQDQSLH